MNRVLGEVNGRVGNFFRNTVRMLDITCSVCTVAVSGYSRCYRCKIANDEWGGRLADLVMPLAYAYNRISSDGRHQSEHHMWSYKAPYPAPGPVTDLTMMLLVALHWHRRCAEARVGRPWDVWTTVPSSKHARVGQHPLVGLGVNAGLGSAALPIGYVEMRLLGEPSNERCVRAGRFEVVDPRLVAGRHVLLLEDTWVTGSSPQSAALALKDAGAAAVTVLCLARWLSEKDNRVDVAGFFNGLPPYYDALSCPVGDGARCGGPLTPPPAAS